MTTRKLPQERESWPVRVAAMMLGAAFVATVFVHWIVTNFVFAAHDWVLVPFVLSTGLALMFPARARTFFAFLPWKRK